MTIAIIQNKRMQGLELKLRDELAYISLLYPQSFEGP
jgi:hypothetical protein